MEIYIFHHYSPKTVSDEYEGASLLINHMDISNEFFQAKNLPKSKLTSEVELRYVDLQGQKEE
jgi:hypothetical protein